MQVIVDNLVVNYEIHGVGKPIVLLHGWGDNLNSFKSLVSSLESEYRLISLDLPGQGISERPPIAWNLTNYAEFIKSFLQKINVVPFAIIGHSNGGAIAIAGLAGGILKAEKLVLIASSGVRDIETAKKLGLKLVARSGKLATAVIPKRSTRILRKKFYNHIGSDLLVEPHLEETFKLVIAQDIQTEASQLKLPTYIIYGIADQVTPYNSVGVLLHHRIIGSKVNIIDGAEHFVHQTHSAQVAESILDFLA